MLPALAYLYSVLWSGAIEVQANISDAAKPAATEMGITYDTAGMLRRLGEKALREQLGTEYQGQADAER